MNTYGTRYADLFRQLAAPFTGREGEQVKTRNQAGRQFRYVTARTVMNRLDSVVGPENWWDRYTPGQNSVLCELTIRLPDGSTLTKCDAGGYAGMSDEGDDDKSGYSDAFKRAAVKFGVGRYLYNDGVAVLVDEADAGRDGRTEPADRGDKAEPERRGRKGRGTWGQGQGQGRGPAPEPPATVRHPAAVDGVPAPGKPFFGWAKDLERSAGFKVLTYLGQWGKFQGFPARLVDWDADQVAAGVTEITRKVAAIESQEPEHAYATA